MVRGRHSDLRDDDGANPDTRDPCDRRAGLVDDRNYHCDRRSMRLFYNLPDLSV
jgi:hypothetical protein